LRTPFSTAAATLLVWTVATVAHAQPNLSQAPVGWDAELRLSEISDRNADPRVVEMTLVAKVASIDVGGGKRVTAWTYDGGLPGPLIRARVGDRLIVHFKNELPETTAATAASSIAASKRS
jgi:FtsP/CotA-like multicopper oxidase with cupredoxin domain